MNIMREHAINSPGFRAFTRAMHQDILVFEPRERLIDACLGSVFAKGPEVVTDLENFLVRWLVPSVSDKQLAELWSAGEADFFVTEYYIREFLTEALQKLRDRRGS